MIIKVRISPKAKQTAFAEMLQNGTIKIRIKEAPENGKANRALIEFLAKTLKLTQKEICILHGKTDRLKLIEIPDNTPIKW
ncbi:MAG: DUF167 domain-containing protein [Candidatus Gracilibacteria bacterium]